MSPMAISTRHYHRLLRLSILLGFLAIAANARPGRHFHPCKTLIVFSSSSSNPLHQNPNSSPQNPSSTFSGRPSLTFFLTEVREFDPKLTFRPSHPSIFVDRANIDEEKQPLPFGFRSSSFGDRTKDILRDVGSLLLGVACGAITAGTLYLIWSLFADPNSFEISDSDDVFYDDVSPKKMGYVAVPAADTQAVAVPPAKEVV